MAKEILATVEKSRVWAFVGIGSLILAGGLVLVAWDQSRKADKADTAAKDAADERDKTEEAVEEVTLSASGMGTNRGNRLLENLMTRKRRGWAF